MPKGVAPTPAARSKLSANAGASSNTKPTNAGGGDRSGQSFVTIPAGEFLMGSDNTRFPADGEGPVRRVALGPYEISRYAVTNEQFGRFVEATGHVTDAERYGWSFVFHLFVPRRIARRVRRVVSGVEWWWQVNGACWKHPEGLGATVEDRQDHPVVHVSWNDAVAYCSWAHCRLPTEAEWEYAARGGLEQAVFPWGDELEPGGEYRCNVWQGEFPTVNTADDGYSGTAPVDAYEPNGYGLYNTSGNVWELCGDWFSADFHRKAAGVSTNDAQPNPKGPPTGEAKVIKGGRICATSRTATATASPLVAPTPSTARPAIWGFALPARPA